MKKTSNNVHSSSKEIKQILGKPYYEKSQYNETTELSYRDAWTLNHLGVLYYDGKIVYYGSDNKYRYINALYNQSMIDYGLYAKAWESYKEDDEREHKIRVLRAQEKAVNDKID